MPKHSFLMGLCLAVAIVALSACGQGMEYQTTRELPAIGWNKDSIQVFEFALDEPSPSNNVYINIRNKEDYAYSNLWLFMSIESPNGDLRTDTIEFILAEPSGQWLGSGIGDLYDNSIIYKQGISFGDSGTYKIAIQQGMRADVLEGISDIGVSVEKNQTEK